MKIGIDIRNVGKQRTGDETVFFHLAKHLPQVDENNEYYYFTDTLEVETLLEIERQLSILDHPRVKVIPLPSRNKFIWNLWTLPRQLHKHQLDIYLTQYITPWFVPKKIKIVTIIHDISFNFFPQFMKWSDWIFLKTLIPISLKRASKILAVSQFTQKEIKRYYQVADEKVDYFYNAVDLKKFEDLSGESMEEVRKKYNLPEKFILYLGTFQPRKNLPILVEAFRVVKDKHPDMKLVLVGNPKAHNTDKRLGIAIKECHLEDDIIFPGFIEERDKTKVFALADLFCYPSLYEGFGIPILEALAAKTPVVASDILPHREVAGESVLFFPAKDSQALALKIEELLINEHLREELKKVGRTQVEKFSWEASAKKVASIFQSLG